MYENFSFWYVGEGGKPYDPYAGIQKESVMGTSASASWRLSGLMGTPPLPVESALSPERFQDYLLDLVNLQSLQASVGDFRTRDANPVSNWVRTLGLTLTYDERQMRYLLVLSDGTVYAPLPEYLVRYLDLLQDDPFTDEAAIPAYQALALLSYVSTTERYKQSQRSVNG